MLKTMTIDPFIHSIPLELDWETHDSRLDDAVEEWFASVGIQGHANKIKSHLRALLIICARLHRDVPDHYVAYPRNNSFDHQATHYNPLGLKMRSMKKIIDALRPDYLDHHNGYNWFADKEAKRSRLRPNERLVALMNKHQLGDREPR